MRPTLVVLLLAALVLLEITSLVSARVGFECEAGDAKVKRTKVSKSTKIKDTIARHTVGPLGRQLAAWRYTAPPPLTKAHPIARGQTLDQTQGPTWELQTDEIWVGGQMYGYNSEMVLPPRNGYYTEAKDGSHIRQFCDSMEDFTQGLDRVCHDLMALVTAKSSIVRFQDVANDPLDITVPTRADYPGKVNWDCTPQITISLPPNRLWCLLNSTVDPARSKHMYMLNSKPEASKAEVDEIDKLGVSGGAKMWLYLVGRMIKIGQTQGATQNYLKSYAGSILTRQNLADLYANATTTQDKQTLTAKNGVQGLIAILQTTTGLTLTDANLRLFPHGWRSVPNPTITVHAYLTDLLAGVDPISRDFANDQESFSKWAYPSGDPWVVEFRDPERMYGMDMGIWRNVMMHMYHLAHHFEHADMTNGCPGLPTLPSGTNSAIATFAVTGQDWAKCRNVANTPFASCR